MVPMNQDGFLLTEIVPRNIFSKTFWRLEKESLFPRSDAKIEVPTFAQTLNFEITWLFSHLTLTIASPTILQSKPCTNSIFSNTTVIRDFNTWNLAHLWGWTIEQYFTCIQRIMPFHSTARNTRIITVTGEDSTRRFIQVNRNTLGRLLSETRKEKFYREIDLKCKKNDWLHLCIAVLESSNGLFFPFLFFSSFFVSSLLRQSFHFSSLFFRWDWHSSTSLVVYVYVCAGPPWTFYTSIKSTSIPFYKRRRKTSTYSTSTKQ